MKLSRDPEYIAWLALNKKPRSNEKMLTYKEQTKSVKQWAVILNLKPKTIHERLRTGWTVEQTLETPQMTNQYQ
jgi:hypothetical protein